jgi:hypothetical protein
MRHTHSLSVRMSSALMADDSELFANSLIPDELPIIQAHMKTITTMSDDSRVTFLYK